MIDMQTLINTHPEWGITGWEISDTTVSLFVLDASRPTDTPKTIDGKTVVIYQSN